MQQLNSQVTDHQLNAQQNSAVEIKPNLELHTTEQSNSPEQLNSVMSELNRLSKSFVDSYQNLEGQVEKLHGQLQSETKQKNKTEQEKQKLIGEKAFLSDRLQSLLAIMPAGVVVIDGEGKVKDCNAKAIDILGRPLLGELWVSVIHRVFQPQADDGHQVSLKDGRKIHIETRALDVEPGQLVVLTDLTKSRQLQAEQTQQQKLTSMGQMIASLAHQIRTPLSAAILYGSHLNKESLDGELKQKFSGHLLERLHFMERQINDMLGFVRGERKQKKDLSIDDLYQRVTQLKSDFPEYVEFESNYSTSEKIFCDEDALVGAIINLIENACDACKDKSSPKVKLVFSADNSLTIAIKDNGVGILKSQQQKIFEPFHTSKSSGNGLGLAIVHGIVVEHQGKIKVESKKNKGAKFEINLPLIKVTKSPKKKVRTSNSARVKTTHSQQEKSYEF